MKTKYLYRKIDAVLFTGVVIIFLFACTKDKAIPSTAQLLPGVVSFSVNIIPIFNASCNSSPCHRAVSPSAGLDLTPTSAYSSLFAKHEIYTANPSGSHLYIEVSNGQMPPGSGLGSYNQQLILKWIQQGANNN